MSDMPNKTDRAGAMPHAAVEIRGRDVSDADNKLVRNIAFYMQEVIKLFPAGARISLIANWVIDGASMETINFGTLSNTEIIMLLVTLERQRLDEESKKHG